MQRAMEEGNLKGSRELAYPIGCKDDELVSVCDLAIRDIRNSNDTIILKARVTERPGHGESRRVVEG